MSSLNLSWFFIKIPSSPAESLRYQRSWKCPDLGIFCNEIPSLPFEMLALAVINTTGHPRTQHISCRVILITNWDRLEIIVQSSPVCKTTKNVIQLNSQTLQKVVVEELSVPSLLINPSNINVLDFSYI